VNKIRPNPFFPGESKPLSNAIGVVWRELATSVNGLVDAENELVLKSPDGHYWRVQVTNAGALTTTDLGLTKP
jgi:hypothetical protein